eukprot:scaffold50386_cov65-Phaeocystis_antarctica.AAC.9
MQHEGEDERIGAAERGDGGIGAGTAGRGHIAHLEAHRGTAWREELGQRVRVALPLRLKI